MCHSVNGYAKTNNKCMKDFDENKYSLYLKNWDINNVYDLTMSQKLPVNDFQLVGDISEFDESFIKSYIIKKVMKDIFLKLMFNILENYITFIMIYHFYLKERKLKKSKSS